MIEVSLMRRSNSAFEKLEMPIARVLPAFWAFSSSLYVYQIQGQHFGAIIGGI